MTGIVYITNQSFTATANRAMNVEYLNVVSLPDGRYIKSAVRQHNKLTITAKDEWAMRTAEEQKATLRKLFSVKSKEKVDFILVTDGLGRPLGNVSAYALSLGNPEKQNAEKLQ
jgi:hypothetical protein